MIHTVTGMSFPPGDSEVHHGVQGSLVNKKPQFYNFVTAPSLIS